MEEILLKTILAEKEKVLTTNIEAVSIISTPPPSHLRIISESSPLICSFILV